MNIIQGELSFSGYSYNGYDATYGDTYTIVQTKDVYNNVEQSPYCFPWTFSVANPGFTQGMLQFNSSK